MEPSGLQDTSEPDVYPNTLIHLFVEAKQVRNLELHSYARIVLAPSKVLREEVNANTRYVTGGCPYTIACEFMLSEMGIPFKLHGLEMKSLPAWYLRTFGNHVSHTPVAWCPLFQSSDYPGYQKDDLTLKSDSVQGAMSDTSYQTTDDYFLADAQGILKRAMQLYPLQSTEYRIDGALIPFETGLPSFTPADSYAAGLAYLNQSALDANSLAARNIPHRVLLSKEEQEGAVKDACIACARAMHPLEAHLAEYDYCCGSSPGIDDFIRFTLLMFVFDLLAPTWHYADLFWKLCPKIRKWMRRMGTRPTNPYYPIYSVLSSESMKFSETEAKRFYTSNDFLNFYSLDWSIKLPNRAFPKSSEYTDDLKELEQDDSVSKKKFYSPRSALRAERAANVSKALGSHVCV